MDHEKNWHSRFFFSVPNFQFSFLYLLTFNKGDTKCHGALQSSQAPIIQALSSHLRGCESELLCCKNIFQSCQGQGDSHNFHFIFHFCLWKCNRNLAIFITLFLLSLFEMQRMKNEYTLISLTRGLIDIRRFMRYMIKTFCSTKLNGKQDNLNIDKDWWNICFIKNIHYNAIFLHNSCGLNKRVVPSKWIDDCIHKS